MTRVLTAGAELALAGLGFSAQTGAVTGAGGLTVQSPGLYAVGGLTLTGPLTVGDGILVLYGPAQARDLTQSGGALTGADTLAITGDMHWTGGEHGGDSAGTVTEAAAASVSITLPIIIVILVFQKHLVKGLGAGAVKG